MLDTICDGVQSYCFEKEMQNTNLSNCNCFENCEDLKFSISEFTHRVEVEEECRNQIKEQQNLYGTQQLHFDRNFNKPYSLQIMLAERAK